MRKGNIDWEQFAKELLWNRIVYDKNGDSGYEINTEHEVGRFSILAYHTHPYKELTWKELALELGLWEEQLISDGHNCHECPERETCSALFKDDSDHEQCSGWQNYFGFSKAPEQHELTEDEITKAYYKRWLKDIKK